MTSLGSAIFAFLAAGTFKTIEEAQDALCPSFDVVEPDPREAARATGCSPLYRELYFALGRQDAGAAALGDVLPDLRRIAAAARQS